MTAALAQFDRMWTALSPAEQARVVQLWVARVTVGEAGLVVDLRQAGRNSRPCRPAKKAGGVMNETLRIHIPLTIRRRGGRPRILPPKEARLKWSEGSIHTSCAPSVLFGAGGN